MRGLLNYFPKQQCHVTFPLAIQEGCNFSTSLSKLFIVSLFDDNHPSRCKVVSHIVVLICIFLMFNDIGHIFLCCLDIYISWEMSIQVHCPFLITLSSSLLLNRTRSLYILNTSLLSSLWLANIFSHSGGWFFNFLIVSFEPEVGFLFYF